MNGFWYITDLNIGPLHDNSLICAQNPEFRPQIFELNHLKSLSFFNCFTSLNNPTFLPTKNWEKLASTLESLEFRSNPSLIGSIPSVFGNLQKLQSLVLIEDGISGNVPTNIGNLGQLKRLVLSGNRLTGQIPDNLGNLTKLLILDLSRNSLNGHLPFSIGYLNSLLKLDLSNNRLVGNIPKELGNLKNLTLLDLGNNNFSGGLTRSLEEMDSLQELILSNNPIGGDIKTLNWEKLQNLMIMDLSNLGLTGEIPDCMAKLKKLRYVGLGNNNLTGNLPPELANMPCVGAIYVNGNNLTGELKFPEGFYSKLGRRFWAWNNPNLCYPGGLMPTGHAPVGVEPCKSEEIFDDPNFKSELGDGYENLQQQQPVQIKPLVGSKDLNPDYMSSLGLSSFGINGIWWVFLAEIFMVILLWNCFT